MSHQLIDTHIVVKLREPFWGAWKKYVWEKGVEGLGIKENLVTVAEMAGKKILVSYKYGDYEITTKKIRQLVSIYRSEFTARDGTLLVVVPRHKFKKLNLKED